jgi:hypothetical protein
MSHFSIAAPQLDLFPSSNLHVIQRGGNDIENVRFDANTHVLIMDIL